MGENGKKAAAKKAIEYIHSGMIIGVGSGSTVKYLIEFLASKIKRGEIQDLKAIPSSYDTRMKLHEHGIECVDLLDYPQPDLTIDGADSVYLDKKILIKGGGGAFLREKVIGYSARKLVIIVDETKINRPHPVPIEVLPFALGYVMKKLGSISRNIIVRDCKGKLSPCISDNGNIILDADFSNDMLGKELEKELNMIPGVLENGIFSRSAEIIVGRDNGYVETYRI